LKADESKKIFIDFKKNKTNFDGIMEFSINRNGIINNYNFGYYSNGIPPEDIIIIVKKDTILFD
jgi:hypothetical protein